MKQRGDNCRGRQSANPQALGSNRKRKSAYREFINENGGRPFALTMAAPRVFASFSRSFIPEAHAPYGVSGGRDEDTKQDNARHGYAGNSDNRYGDCGASRGPCQ